MSSSRQLPRPRRRSLRPSVKHLCPPTSRIPILNEDGSSAASSGDVAFLTWTRFHGSRRHSKRTTLSVDERPSAIVSSMLPRILIALTRIKVTTLAASAMAHHPGRVSSMTLVSAGCATDASQRAAQSHGDAHVQGPPAAHPGRRRTAAHSAPRLPSPLPLLRSTGQEGRQAGVAERAGSRSAIARLLLADTWDHDDRPSSTVLSSGETLTRCHPDDEIRSSGPVRRRSSARLPYRQGTRRAFRLSTEAQSVRLELDSATTARRLSLASRPALHDSYGTTRWSRPSPRAPRPADEPAALDRERTRVEAR